MAQQDIGILTALENSAIVIDCREPSEISEAGDLIKGAINIPVGNLNSRSEGLPHDKTDPIIVYCRSGARAGRAKVALESFGFTNVFNGVNSSAMRSLNHEL